MNNNHEIISIKIKNVKQLFNSFDPSPFIDKGLDKDAFEYITGSVNAYPIKSNPKLEIHLPKSRKNKFSEKEITLAINNYFSYKKELEEINIRNKIKEGQKSFIIGIAFLIACLSLRELLNIRSNGSFFIEILKESLIIFGWVAMWKPISNMLYDWWPLSKQKNTYNKISEIKINFIYY